MQAQLLQQYEDGDEGADGDDGGGDDDDDPDEVHLDGGVDGDDLPSPGRNSPGRNLYQRDLSLLVFSAPQRRWNLSMVAPRVLGFREVDIRQRGEAGVGQGGHTTPRRDLGLPAPWGGVGPLWPTSTPSSGILSLLEK